MEIYQVLENYLKLLLEVYKDKLSSVRASGELADTASYEIQSENDGYSLYLILLDYWQWVEDGRAAGKFPPYDKDNPKNGVIYKWIEAKNIIPNPYILPDGEEQEVSKEQFAYLVMRKISEEGTPGYDFLQESIDETIPYLYVNLPKAFTTSLVDEFNNA
jgi:hypothetical protein